MINSHPLCLLSYWGIRRQLSAQEVEYVKTREAVKSFLGQRQKKSLAGRKAAAGPCGRMLCVAAAGREQRRAPKECAWRGRRGRVSCLCCRAVLPRKGDKPPGRRTAPSSGYQPPGSAAGSVLVQPGGQKKGLQKIPETFRGGMQNVFSGRGPVHTTGQDRQRSAFVWCGRCGLPLPTFPDSRRTRPAASVALATASVKTSRAGTGGLNAAVQRLAECGSARRVSAPLSGRRAARAARRRRGRWQ